ncbi:hypothetical protein K1719_018588 [Acacia pycnantha]|nr:hypothetical protein K1719_018588 [Acacia pycnantha]
MGYMAPEFVTTGKASKESDVNSFVVFSPELVCGRKPINLNAPDDEINIVNWEWNLYGNGIILEAVDPRLQDFDHDQVECLMIVGLWPSIRQAIHVLNFETAVPSLPSSFTSFQQSQVNLNISLEPDAVMAEPHVYLVQSQTDQSRNNSQGRATYTQAMHLWDKTTGKLANFNTNFTFVINSEGRNEYGDGLTFFLAPEGSKLPNPPKVGGGSMGLIIGGQETLLNSTDHPFVAVEFDIFPNIGDGGWDPPYVHVGVDINSIQSNMTVPWNANIRGAGTNEAFINYNASTHNLSISFTNGSDASNNIVWQHLHYIVDLTRYLPEWVIFGFSAATGSAYASHRIDTWSFNSEVFPNVAPTPSTSRNDTALAIGLGVGGFILVGGFICFFLWKNKKKMEYDESDENTSDDFERGTGPKKYSYAELASAANYFKDGQKLGQGGFGGVYKGFLRDSNSYVAIKRISKDSKQGKKEFSSEVRIISQLRHRNLVQLRSGLASALLYLHEEWEQCVVHRDIKSSNIMLDSSFNAKLGDFGLARLVDHAKGGQTTALAGTMGYMAPECVTTGRASKETDVYSFGVVALEIVCGRKPIISEAPENEINIVNWAWDLYGSGRILEAVDSRLEGDFDHDQVECLLIVGLWCAHPDQNRRPSIRQAIHVLNFETPFPNLPSSYPILSYLEFPASFSILPSSNASGVTQNQNISFSSNTNTSGFSTTSGDNVSPSVSLLYSRKN